MDFLIQNAAFFWLVMAIFFLLMEIVNPGLFFFISFSFGGLAAAGASVMVCSPVMQTIIFFIVTLLALLCLRHILPLLEKNRPQERTNVYAMLGKRVFVTEPIKEKRSGMVKINGVTWAARCVRGTMILIGEEIEVVDIKGTHVIVKKITQGV
jgi:membrane protein implicated in regulation of membrane protease activity